MVSCSRSSASAGLRVIRSAPPYSWSSSGIASRSKRAVSSASVSLERLRAEPPEAPAASAVSGSVALSMSAIVSNAVPSVAMPVNRSINTGPGWQPANCSSPMRLVAVDTEFPFPNLKAATDTVCVAWVNSGDGRAISGSAGCNPGRRFGSTVSSVTVTHMSLKAKTMFISGASRGIGLAIAKRAAQDGANIALIAKPAEPHPKLPGTVFTAAKELEEAGGQALPIVGDVRDPDSVEAAVAKTVEQFGGVDICVNNASAINLGSISEVPMKRFDLMNGIQVRGTYAVSRACLAHMKGRENPHVLTLSPPVLLGQEWLKPTAYMMAKFGMTLCALGIAEEMRSEGIASNTLWPRTLVATAAVQNLLGGDEAMGRARKPEVYSDAAYVILNKPAREYTGNMLLCEDVLVESGVKDLSVYDCIPGSKLGVDFWVDGVNPPGYTQQ